MGEMPVNGWSVQVVDDLLETHHEPTIPTHGGTLLRERHVRILWASWPIPSDMAWARLRCWCGLPEFQSLLPAMALRIKSVTPNV